MLPNKNLLRGEENISKTIATLKAIDRLLPDLEVERESLEVLEELQNLLYAAVDFATMARNNLENAECDERICDIFAAARKAREAI